MFTLHIEVGIGDRTVSAEIPDGNYRGTILPRELPLPESETELLEEAIRHPIGSRALSEIVRPGQKIAILTSDVTRPLPTARVLPTVLRELLACGASPEDITLIVAIGSHRLQTEEELRHIAGDAYGRIRCINADLTDTVLVGTTRRGTPVEVARAAAEADIRICLGNIDFHYFAGFSGGAKALVPGVCTRRTIQANHSHMVEPGAYTGNLDGNPVREDLEEAASFCGIDFIVNVVLDAHKNIVHAVAGDYIRAHRAGCAYLDRYYRSYIDAPADIVIVSQGGAPKDLNLYQAQKALDNAKHACRDGGTIILVASCHEGLGESTFESWLLEAEHSHDLIERLHRNFRLGGHKAAAIAMVLETKQIDLVSDLDADFVRKIFLTPRPTLQAAVDAALAKYGPGAGVWVMPYGGGTLPTVGQQPETV